MEENNTTGSCKPKTRKIIKDLKNNNNNNSTNNTNFTNNFPCESNITGITSTGTKINKQRLIKPFILSNKSIPNNTNNNELMNDIFSNLHKSIRQKTHNKTQKNKKINTK